MPTEFKLPNLGENIDSAEVTTVLVSVGDTVSADQDLLEVETGKATMPVPAPRAGRVAEIKVSSGDKVSVGQLIMVLEDADGAAAPADEPAAAAAAAEVSKPEESAPPADEVAEPEQAAEEAPKAATPAPIQYDIPDPDGDQVRAIPTSPSVRRFAREFGIDISQVSGTGPKGRIVLDDIKAYARGRFAELDGGTPMVSAGGSLPARSLPDFSSFGETSTERVAGIRKITAEHMAFCWATIPHVTQFDKADITDLEAQRKQLGKELAASNGPKVTVTAILLKVVAQALKQFPQFNVSLDMARQQVVQKHYVHIGVAVDTPRGLVVPVIRDVDQKGIIALAQELTDFSLKARDGKLSPADMQGGCFTISNLGGIGGNNFTPIVNWPEVAILGVARGENEPVWNGEQFIPRMRMPLSLSYDHRVIDGADGARFLRWIAAALEQPLRLALG